MARWLGATNTRPRSPSRELEALSGQRQNFKPGLTADNITDDQEVAA